MTPPAAGNRSHPIRRMRSWRRNRREARLEQEMEAGRSERFYGYRIPVQVCPRGCGFNEQARRDLLVQTGFWGRANVDAVISFETTHCPRDGAKLIRRCARCERPVFAPVVDRCQFCGVPQPWATERRAGAERANLRRWQRSPEEIKRGVNRVHDPALHLYGSLTEEPEERPGDVWVVEGDIARLDVDAVISNDDVDGQMWSQSGRAIKNAAGEGVERLAQEEKPFSLGHAWLTTAGDLKQMKNIIHVASMSRYGRSNISTVRKCLRAALELAAKKEFGSVGLTAFGTGPAAINPNEWIEAFAEVTVDFLSGAGKVERTTGMAIVLVLFERHAFEEQTEALRGAFRRAWVKAGEPSDSKPHPFWPVTL